MANNFQSQQGENKLPSISDDKLLSIIRAALLLLVFRELKSEFNNIASTDVSSECSDSDTDIKELDSEEEQQ